jgi:hypothetical protein
MAAITQSAVAGVNGPVNVTRTTLGASDTLTYSSGTRQMLDLVNTTGSPVVVTITGSTATTISPDGYGGTISVASGKAITVPANGQTIVNLDTISAYLSGSVTVTGGTGVIAALYV